MKRGTVNGLSTNDQMVLYHLTKSPTLSDQEICGRIGMKQSTFSTIKKKLRSDGYFHSYYTPMFQHLGCELLVTWYVTLNRKTRTEDRLSLTRNHLLGAPDLCTILSESNQAIILSISRNIGEHIRVSDALVQLYEENDFLETIDYVMFPFDVSSIYSYFDFAPLLNRIFCIDPSDEHVNGMDVSSPEIKCSVVRPELNELEKRVFLGLVRHPEMSDSGLSERIGCSRPVFTRIKNRLLSERMLEKRRIVSLEKLGFKMLTLTHSKFNPLKPLDERQICVEHTKQVQTPIFNISRDPEGVMVSAYRDFEEYKQLHNEYVAFCEKHDTLRGDPTVILLSIPRLFEVKWLVFEPLVRKVLDDL